MSKQEHIEIVYLPIDQILEYENNPRNNEKAVPAVVKSIRKYGIRTPAIVDRNNVLLAGHTRIRAAKELGYTEYPCVRADSLSDSEGKAFRLEDNRTQEDSSWDTEALSKEFKALQDNGFDLSETGFDEFEINGIDMGAADYDSSPEDYDTPETESGECAPEEEEEPEQEEPDEEFAVLIACKDEEEKAMVAEIIGEKEELRRRYTVAQVRKMLEGDGDDAEES